MGKYADVGAQADADIAALTGQLAAAQADDASDDAQIAQLTADLLAAKSDDTTDDAAIAKLTADLAAADARIAVLVAGAPTQSTRPVGPDYVRYEDLYRAGDTVGQALARLVDPKIVTFPEGRFEASDFNSGFQAGIFVPAVCRGIVGAGPGTLGGSTGTVFSLKAGSSTKGGGARDSNGNLYVPVQDNKTPTQLNLLKQLNQGAPSVWKGFQVAGTEQGHVYSGFQVYGTAGANTFEDILSCGWAGDSGAPPGETSAMSVSGRGQHQLARIEVDGRRSVGGPVFGAMGLTIQNGAGSKIVDSFLHHTRVAAFVAFQAFNGELVNVVMDSVTDVANGLGNGGFNLERTSGWKMTGGRIVSRKQRVHVTHSTDHYTLTIDGVTYTTDPGLLTLVGVDLAGDPWGNGLGYFQTWSPYGNGSTMKPQPQAPNGYAVNGNVPGVPACAPVVLKADGVTHQPYRYVLDQHYYVS